jgi:hypothetical protein
MTTRRVKPGQPLAIKAAEYNAILEAADAVAAGRFPGGKPRPTQTDNAAGLCWVWAQSHAAMAIGAPVVVSSSGLGDVSTDDETTLSINRQITYMTNPPNFVETVLGYPNQNVAGVTLDPAAAGGQLIRVAVAGVAWARVPRTAPFSIGIGYRNSTDADRAVSFRMLPIGHHKLLRWTSSAGAFVLVNGNNWSTINCKADTTVGAGVGAVKILQNNNTTLENSWKLTVANYSARATTNGNILICSRINDSDAIQIVNELCGVAE